MSIKSIITHPGGAHKDEFLACSVLLALYPVSIKRCEPVAIELEDASIAVIDVGHLHQPNKHNFDHHQFPRTHPPTCSLSLVLEHLGLYEDAREFCDWLEPAEWFDCRGAVNTAKWLGVERNIINKLNSPMDITLLRRFAQVNELNLGEPLWEIMRMIGADLIEYLKTLRERLDFIEQQVAFYDLEHAGVTYQVLHMPRTNPLPPEPSMGLDRFIESQDTHNNVIGMIYPDRRGEGYGLSRYNDNRLLDFTRIASCEEVHFAHKQGFIAKTSTTDTKSLLALMASAIVP